MTLPSLVLFGVDLPDLLHAEAEFLRVLARLQVVFRQHFLGQRPAHAFAEEDVFAVQLHPRLIAVAGGAVGVLAELARDDALHLAVLAIDDLGTGHAGKDLDAQLLGLFGHPATDIAHRDDVVAVVVHQAAASSSSGCADPPPSPST
jgi:hypothetical protein